MSHVKLQRGTMENVLFTGFARLYPSYKAVSDSGTDSKKPNKNENDNRTSVSDSKRSGTGKVHYVEDKSDFKTYFEVVMSDILSGHISGDVREFLDAQFGTMPNYPQNQGAEQLIVFLGFPHAKDGTRYHFSFGDEMGSVNLHYTDMNGKVCVLKLGIMARVFINQLLLRVFIDLVQCLQNREITSTRLYDDCNTQMSYNPYYKLACLYVLGLPNQLKPVIGLILMDKKMKFSVLSFILQSSKVSPYITDQYNRFVPKERDVINNVLMNRKTIDTRDQTIVNFKILTPDGAYTFCSFKARFLVRNKRVRSSTGIRYNDNVVQSLDGVGWI